ncbi:transcription initiation factor TFIID subunit 8 [Actinomortierella ambigua]|nr:transcription initiation factor TFIID subunit 8 [Actinomortierella ambigua]
MNPPPGFNQGSNGQNNNPFGTPGTNNDILAAMPLSTLSFDSNTIAAFPRNSNPTLPMPHANAISVVPQVAIPTQPLLQPTAAPPMMASPAVTIPTAAPLPGTATSTESSATPSVVKKRKKALRKIDDMEPAPPPSNRMDRATADATCQRLMAVLALNAGFNGSTTSALYHLTSMFEHYTQQLYSVAHAFAEHAGRTQPSVHDLQQALKDVKVDPQELIQYIKKAKESKIPLLKGALKETIPEPKKFKQEVKPVLASDEEELSESEEEPLEEEEQQLHEKSKKKDGAASGPAPRRVPIRKAVPDHLPPFPSKHTYKRTPVYFYRATDPQTIREMNAEQSRLVETNLKRLMAAENKISMAQHKDTLDTLDPTTGRAGSAMAMSDDDDGPSSSTSKSQARLEALPIVNFENARRQQQQQRKMQQGLGSKASAAAAAAAAAAVATTTSIQDSQPPQPAASGSSATAMVGSTAMTGNNNHMRVLSTASASSGTSCAVSTKEAWRRERRRMRKLQNDMATSQ